MARPPRVHFSGALFHVMSRGNGGQEIFLEDADRRNFLDMLAAAKKATPFKLYAYCLMSNHFHLLMETDRFSTSAIAQRLLTRYSHYFNARHQSSGHLFQGRYKAVLCEKDSYLLELLRYIHLNPVRARLAAAPSEWRWSGHGEYVGTYGPNLVDVKFPLSLFHTEQKQAAALYEQFVLAGIGLTQEHVISFLNHHPSPRQIQSRLDEILPGSAPQNQKTLEAAAEEISRDMSVPLEMIRGETRHRSVTPARHRLIRVLIDQGFPPSMIAAFLHRSPSAISKLKFPDGF